MFKVRNLEDLNQIIKDNFNDIVLESDLIATVNSVGKITVDDILSEETVPAFNKSTVDGYACKYEDVKLASASSPAMLKLAGEVEMGKNADTILHAGYAIYVPTGGMVPEGADTMVMIENTEVLGKNVLINKKASTFENILKKGDDIKKDEVLVSKNTKISPRIIGALMSQNIREIKVFKSLDCTLISTGDEIVNSDQEISLGQVRDINTHTIKAYISSENVTVVKSSVIQDDFEEYKATVLEGFEHSNIVISSGGSSVGEKDYTINILEAIGAEVILHGLNVKPGKPTILAKYKGKIFIGLPGHPSSAYVVLHMLFNRLIEEVYKVKQHIITPYIEATLTQNVHNNSGRTLIQLVEIENNKSVLCSPIFAKSAMINSLQNAYGYIIVDRNSEGLYQGETVKVYRFGD